MKSKKIIIGIIILIAITGLVLIIRGAVSKAKGPKSSAVADMKKASPKAPAAKVISKGKGALTVKIFNSKNIEIPMRIKAFQVIDKKSSVYAAASVGGRMQELLPGYYDIEADTVPQKIFKNIKVSQGRETVENFGCVTGSLVIRTLNSKKSAASYPMRVLYPKTSDMVTAYMTNKAIEIIPGVYDVEIGTSPRQYKRDIRVEAGKETIVDLGCMTGSIMVKTVDENKRDVRSSVRIMRSDVNEIVSSGVSNRSVELGKGVYNIDLLTSPKQSKKDIKVNTGEATVVEFTVKAPVVSKPARSKK